MTHKTHFIDEEKSISFNYLVLLKLANKEEKRLLGNFLYLI